MVSAIPMMLAFGLVAPAVSQDSLRIGGSAPVNGTSLHYEVFGPERNTPPIVLVSGGGTLDRRMWDGQLAAFAEEHTVIRYDLRGIGRSARPQGPFSHSEDLRALLQFLEVPKAAVVGLSLGAAIAVDLALEHPELVTALVLAGPGLSSDREENLEAALAVAEMARKDGFASVIELMLTTPAFLATGDPAIRDRVRQIYLDNADVFESDFAHVRWWRPPEPPAGGRLRLIRAPTLVLLGERDGTQVRATAEALVKSIADSEMKLLPNAGHLLNLDAPEAFNREVLLFLSDRK